MATLENEFIRVDVTPLWGGRVHRAVDKRTGRHLCYFNREHQPVNDGVVRAVELGGIEWNWAPNQIGHATFVENPVYVARIKTSRGDALRIWEYGMINDNILRPRTVRRLCKPS